MAIMGLRAIAGSLDTRLPAAAIAFTDGIGQES
jgi:hypothetical protein